MKNSQINVVSNNSGDYKLLDSGNRKKLEKIGNVTIVRSEPRAWWKPRLDQKSWMNIDFTFETETDKKWTKNKLEKAELDINVGILKARVKFNGSSKQIGVFPEQQGQWALINNIIKKEVGSDKKIKLLNLFGYTGLASIAGALAGASVTHVDSSKTAIAWAKENQTLNNLPEDSIRWIEEDSISFLKREIRRGEKYDAIIMDPPTYGKGNKGQVWKAEKQIPELLDLCSKVLSDKPLFIVINMYSTELSSLSIKNLLSDIKIETSGQIESGELTIPEENSQRIIPMSIYATWTRS